MTALNRNLALNCLNPPHPSSCAILFCLCEVGTDKEKVKGKKPLAQGFTVPIRFSYQAISLDLSKETDCSINSGSLNTMGISIIFKSSKKTLLRNPDAINISLPDKVQLFMPSQRNGSSLNTLDQDKRAQFDLNLPFLNKFI